MNNIDDDSDIRSKIVITDNIQKKILNEYTDIELAAKYSKNDNNFDILKLLLKKNKYEEINLILRTTVLSLKTTSSFEAVKLLIGYGADINFCHVTWYNPLMSCCVQLSNSNIEIINFLIENGANVNSVNCGANKNSFHTNPLQLLIEFSSTSNHLEIIKLLIRKGAHINLKNSCYVTPLMNCIQGECNKFIRYNIIKLLLDNKADVYIKNENGQNIFDIVKKRINENSDIYSLIFDYKNIVNDNFCDYDIDFIYC